MDKILKTFLNSPAFIGFFAIFGYWLFFKPKNKTLDSLSTTNPLSYEDSKKYADALHVAMGSTFLDYETIKTVLSKLNADSYKQVYNTFGLRGYIDLFGGHGTDLPMATQLNLFQWFNEEVTGSRRKEIEKLYPFVF